MQWFFIYSVPHQEELLCLVIENVFAVEPRMIFLN